MFIYIVDDAYKIPLHNCGMIL